MGSDSDTSEVLTAKVEPDSENEGDSSPNRKTVWTAADTRKLIVLWEKECRELWDTKHPLIRDRKARNKKHEYLGSIFGTSTEEVIRKLHNLRTQFNNELRKIKRRQDSIGGAGSSGQQAISGWEHYESMSFLLRQATGETDAVDSINLELAEYLAQEEEDNTAALKGRSMNESPIPSSSKPGDRPAIRVAASAPLPLPPMMWPEEPLPRVRPGYNTDDCQVFGDFVASELRTLRSDCSRKKLKRIIQKAILMVGEEEDVNIIN